jgi:hypothetical protein
MNHGKIILRKPIMITNTGSIWMHFATIPVLAPCCPKILDFEDKFEIVINPTRHTIFERQALFFDYSVIIYPPTVDRKFPLLEFSYRIHCPRCGNEYLFTTTFEMTEEPIKTDDIITEYDEDYYF